MYQEDYKRWLEADLEDADTMRKSRNVLQLP